MNENKVPCEGFRIGDGLAMDGDTLKSLGGAYIKVVGDIESLGSYKIADDSPLNYETAMKYDGLIFMLIQVYKDQAVFNQAVFPLFSQTTNSLSFSTYSISNSILTFDTINIHEDNSIDTTRKQYILTPAT